MTRPLTDSLLVVTARMFGEYRATFLAAEFIVLSICPIPDDHIDPRRSAFFMARSVLRDIRDGGANAGSTT